MLCNWKRKAWFQAFSVSFMWGVGSNGDNNSCCCYLGFGVQTGPGPNLGLIWKDEHGSSGCGSRAATSESMGAAWMVTENNERKTQTLRMTRIFYSKSWDQLSERCGWLTHWMVVYRWLERIRLLPTDFVYMWVSESEWQVMALLKKCMEPKEQLITQDFYHVPNLKSWQVLTVQCLLRSLKNSV